MNIFKRLFTHRTITAFAVVAALAFPCNGTAVSIGEIELQSKLGEPLLAQVDITEGSGEHIEDFCLSLAAMDPEDKDTTGYITSATLSVKTIGSKRVIAINSRRPLNDAYARLRLQIKCHNVSRVVKTLTILPDLDTVAPQIQSANSSVTIATEEVKVAEPSPPKVDDIPTTANHRAPRKARHNPEKNIAAADTAVPAEHPHKKHVKSGDTSIAQKGNSASFRLKLSGEMISDAQIGKISATERTALLASKKLLDADDQTARFLAMQNQIQQLQSELVELKSQMTQMGVNPSGTASASMAPKAPSLAAAEPPKLAPPAPAIATPALNTPLATPVSATPAPSTPAPQTAAATSPASATPVVHTKPAAAKQPVVQQTNLDLVDELMVALGAVVLLLATWQGYRFYVRYKARKEFLIQQDVEPHPQPADEYALTDIELNMLPPKTQPETAAKSLALAKDETAPSIPSLLKTSSKVGEVAAAPHSAAPPPPPPPQKVVEEPTEEDSMLEEAGLYASHGRPAKAAEILQEVIQRRPAKAEAWTLLLSIYSSLAKAAEFEKTAREFLKHHKDSPLWSGIQALGRTFDQNNPLYIDSNSRNSGIPLLSDQASSRRPVGDVLIERGVLTKQALQNCLDDFDPKKHGRFGGYLVARKAITLAQLDQALLQQQGVSDEVKSAPLPSLHDMENFLAGYDPKRDGSVADFLAARNAVTPDQISSLVQQQTTQAATIHENPVPSKPAKSSDDDVLDFVFESDSKQPSYTIDFDPTSDNEIPLDLENAPNTLSFPAIDLELVTNFPTKKVGG